MIVNTAPFFMTTVPFHPDRIDAVIDGVRAFSKRQKMDFLLARQSLGPGEFNVSADTPSINLKAMHINGIDDGVVTITAITRGPPTLEDKSLVKEFVAQIRQRNGGP